MGQQPEGIHTNIHRGGRERFSSETLPYELRGHKRHSSYFSDSCYSLFQPKGLRFSAGGSLGSQCDIPRGLRKEKDNLKSPDLQGVQLHNTGIKIGRNSCESTCDVGSGSVVTSAEEGCSRATKVAMSIHRRRGLAYTQKRERESGLRC